ncbi:MAG: histidine triad nucleotide-binding protein [Acidobacteria bacterium]|nr:histidine triad nucleotide-binding protein [Acidobacteriota bacterium]
MEECIFCKIVRGECPAKIVFEDSDTVAFRDIHPQAPTHILVVPRRHVASLHDCSPRDEAMLGHALQVARDLAEEEGLKESGYRVVLNTGAGAGQSVLHLHFHLIGGRPMSWPPG